MSPGSLDDQNRRGAIKGRGTASNPAGRFETIELVREADDPEEPARRTVFLRDTTKSIISRNDSPDVPFDANINVYRGCEHGCVYCYARPTHEYLGFSAGLDFESRILVKERAPELLEHELSSRRWKPQVLGMSGVTDPYQPVERKLQLSRRCLEVLATFRNPVVIVTKNALVTRDLDHLERLGEHNAVAVYVSVTTLDAKLARVLEPRTSHPRRRLEAIRQLSEAGIPVGVLVAPIIPALNDHEVPGVLEAAFEAGARHAGYVFLRLPHGVKELFENWLSEHLPDRKDKILNRIRSSRGGRLNDPEFRTRMRGTGIFAEQIRALFEVTARRLGFESQRPRLDPSSFRHPGGTQLTFFDEVS